MSSPDRAISLSSDTDSDGHPADALIVNKARQLAAAKEAAEHRKKKRRRQQGASQPSSGAPSPARGEDANTAQSSAIDDGLERRKWKKASRGRRPTSISPQPQPVQQEGSQRKGNKRRKKAAAAQAVADASLRPADSLERLARDAPDGAVLAAVDAGVSSSDSATDAEVQIISLPNDHSLANGAARPTAMLLPPGMELSKLLGSGRSLADVQTAVGNIVTNAGMVMVTPKAAAPIGVTVIADDEAVTVNSELQRLLRVPRSAQCPCPSNLSFLPVNEDLAYTLTLVLSNASHAVMRCSSVLVAVTLVDKCVSAGTIV